ncbi:unnamed protein product [Somion occarium]|uniref:Peptidase A1 domain-containing protein n=1 Tax=Somion occarium TaxID=3059160 RepID=A0ABP1E3C5_9APHY
MSPCGADCYLRSRKGKERAVEPRQDFSAPGDGPGADDGIVLPLTLVGTSAYSAIYTIPVLVGTNKQNLSLQVDTGSSDLWIASTSCSSSSCGQAHGSLYDSSHAKPTGRNFQITYVEGEVDGPIVWDTVQLGNYVIDNQAMAAASTVNDEPLSSDFSGILGLALPLNSYISQQLPAGNSDAPDGAIFSSNLFSMTPSSTAPSARFISISLERPGSERIPSLLGIGRHPPSIVNDPSKIDYAPLVSEYSGDYFWKANVNAITVYVDGVPKPISLKSASRVQGSMTTAVVDSGMPIILASPDIANGIYGALGIGPGSDDYVDCTTPINMTVTLDDRPEIPLHPLDLTTSPSSGATSSSCVGIIQAYPAGSSISDIADIVLGVPFMRSTYTVMAYDQPDSEGNFPNMSAPSSASGGSMNSALLRPRLGLLSLTDPTVALDEFNTVRVLKQPLGSAGGANGGAQGQSVSGDDGGGKRLSVGVEVLIGLLGFFALCFVLFAARWAYARRKFKHERAAAGVAGKSNGSGEFKDRDDYLMDEVAFRLSRRTSRNDPYGPSEEALRAMRYSEYKRRLDSEYTDDSGRTRVASPGDKDGVNDFGYDVVGGRSGSVDADADSLHQHHDTDSGEEEDVGDPQTGYQAVKTHVRSDSESSTVPSLSLRRDSVPPRSHTTNSIPDEYLQQQASNLHQRTASGEPGIAAPLLAHTRSDSYISTIQSPDQPAFGFADPRASSRASRLSRMPPPLPLDLPTSLDDPPLTDVRASPPLPAREVNLLGSPLPTSMFDLSSRENVIHSSRATNGHGQVS